MNPFDLDATGLMLWGLVAHLIADWPLQNDWMANNKAKPLTWWPARGAALWEALDGPLTPNWFWRHPAAYVHAGIHGVALALVFGWVAMPLALVHLVIDTRTPVAWWSKLIRQTQPRGATAPIGGLGHDWVAVVDIGTEVRFWTDQVFHIATIAAAALIVSVA